MYIYLCWGGGGGGRLEDIHAAQRKGEKAIHFLHRTFGWSKKQSRSVQDVLLLHLARVCIHGRCGLAPLMNPSPCR